MTEVMDVIMVVERFKWMKFLIELRNIVYRLFWLSYFVLVDWYYYLHLICGRIDCHL